MSLSLLVLAKRDINYALKVLKMFNAIKSNGILLLGTVLITLFAVQWYNNYVSENEIKRLGETLASKEVEISVKDNALVKTTQVLEETVEKVEKAKFVEGKLSKEVINVNNDLADLKRKQYEIEVRLNSVKERVKNIAIKRPESLARLINKSNLKLFERVAKATR